MKSPRAPAGPSAGALDPGQRAHNLGTIETPRREAAEAEAVKLFGLSDEHRKRLAVRERD